MVNAYYYRNIDNNPVAFSVRKVKRLYVLHIGLTIFCLLIKLLPMVMQHSFDHFGALSIQVILHAFLLQAWIPKSEYYFSLNSVSWYLSMSMFLYCCFPWILSRIRRYNGVKSAIDSIFICSGLMLAASVFASYSGAVSARDYFSRHWMTYIFPPYRLLDFVIGCNLGYIFIW